MTSNKPFTSALPNGLRLGDIQAIVDSVVNANSFSSSYNLTATGTTQATATSLTSVVNEIDTVAASSGVNLPSSAGRITTPYKLVIVINNGANSLTVYSAKGTVETIGGSTSSSQTAGSTTLYISAQAGKWFTVGGSSITLPLSIAQGGTGNITAQAARSSTGLNIEEMTTNGDSNYVILSTDRTVATSAALTAARTWTLPAANSVNAGQALTVADKAGGITSTNTLTISRANSDTLNNTTTVVMNVPYQTVTFVSDGVSAWTITANQSGGGLTPPISPASLAALQNAAAIMLPNYTGALAKLRSSAAGTYNFRVLCGPGDSITAGIGATNSVASGQPNQPLCWPQQLADLMNGRLSAINSKLNAHANGFLGTGTANNTLGFSWLQEDPRVAGTGATNIIPSPNLGGGWIAGVSPASAMSFTPTKPVDIFNIFDITFSAAGIYTADINGAGSSSVNQAGSAALHTVQKTGTLGLNTLNLAWSSGGTVFWSGVEAYDSSKNNISFLNGGASGQTAHDMATIADASDPWWCGSAVRNMLGQKLTICMAGINDLAGGASIPTIIGYLQTIITQAQAGGSDVILVGYNPMDASVNFVTVAQQIAFSAAVSALAVTNNVIFIDIYDRMGASYTLANNRGYIATLGGTNGVHPSGIGYADIAQAIFNVIGAP